MPDNDITHLVISTPEQHIHHVISRKVRRQQVALMKQAATEDIELSGKVIEVLTVVLEVSRLKLAQSIVNLEDRNSYKYIPKQMKFEKKRYSQKSYFCFIKMKAVSHNCIVTE